MAVSLREYPVITGKNAQNFLQREKDNKTKLQKKASRLVAKSKTK